MTCCSSSILASLASFDLTWKATAIRMDVIDDALSPVNDWIVKVVSKRIPLLRHQWCFRSHRVRVSSAFLLMLLGQEGTGVISVEGKHEKAY